MIPWVQIENRRRYGPGRAWTACCDRIPSDLFRRDFGVRLRRGGWRRWGWWCSRHCRPSGDILCSIVLAGWGRISCRPRLRRVWLCRTGYLGRGRSGLTYRGCPGGWPWGRECGRWGNWWGGNLWLRWGLSYSGGSQSNSGKCWFFACTSWRKWRCWWQADERCKGTIWCIVRRVSRRSRGYELREFCCCKGSRWGCSIGVFVHCSWDCGWDRLRRTVLGLRIRRGRNYWGRTSIDVWSSFSCGNWCWWPGWLMIVHYRGWDTVLSPRTGRVWYYFLFPKEKVENCWYQQADTYFQYSIYTSGILG